MVEDLYALFRAQVAQVISACGMTPEIGLTVPPRPEFGNLSAAVAFELASRSAGSPRQVAQRLAERMELTACDLVERVAVADAGYLNCHIDHRSFVPRTLAAAEQAANRYADRPAPIQGKVVIEHTSANPHKPWHVGHARSAILGDALGRLFRKAGCSVEIQNYIDDTGIQVAETLLAMDRFGMETSPGACRTEPPRSASRLPPVRPTRRLSMGSMSGLWCCSWRCSHPPSTKPWPSSTRARSASTPMAWRSSHTKAHMGVSQQYRGRWGVSQRRYERPPGWVAPIVFPSGRLVCQV